MESASAFSPAGASPFTAKEPSSDRTDGPSTQNDDTSDPSEDRDSRPESIFESRGNLDTLAAAALKPLGDGTPYNGRPPTPAYQQQHGSTHEHSPRLEHKEGHTHSLHDNRSSRYRYRERGQQVTDDESEDGRNNRSNQQRERAQSPSSYRPSQSPLGSYEQDQSAMATTRPTMSISSLLGDASSTSGPIRKADKEIRPQSCSISHGDDNDFGMSQEHVHRHHHHRHDQAQHPADMMRHHHHHRLAHQHHSHHSPTVQHSHGHMHHHHPSHHVHQHGHQHPMVPHHHHHHVHHHHLHQGRTPKGSAFSYVPKSLGLRLNPRLKVNATQVYISYLIQLDQMQRAQHLMRSSEKKKPTNDSLVDKSGQPSHRRHHSDAHTQSSGEHCSSAHPIPQQEDRLESINRQPSPTPGTLAESEKQDPNKSEDTEMATGEITHSGTAEVSDRASPWTSRQSHAHSHPSHQHQHQHLHGHSHGHVHAHHSAPVLPAHIHPAQHHHHIVPGPGSSKVERGTPGRTNGSPTVHRHHVLHHHHPHHHPYHPNHPNHQHHFHHHPHGVGHGHHHAHGHGHAHGHPHTHPHVHHAHSHSHGGHVHAHPHNHSSSPRRGSSTLERSNREEVLHKKQSKPLLALPAPPTSTATTSESHLLTDVGTDGDGVDNGSRTSPSKPSEQRDQHSISPNGHPGMNGQEPVSVQEETNQGNEDSRQGQGQSTDPALSPQPQSPPSTITSTPFVARSESESAMVVDQ
ncbi:hypothetical protein B0O80DRAFT_466064 [Mortierella sp. GBAus27b]|nr:hypothetical protein B0O80DRAFT_466064 [Mortierella sp. GBAus27b]